MIIHLYHKMRFAILKQKINKNHYIGNEDIDRIYNYQQGSYGIRYRIIKDAANKESIEWVSQRRRLGHYEKRIKKIDKTIFKFWHYQGWLSFLRPPVIFLLFGSIIIFYFGAVETQKAKIERFKFIIASLVNIQPQQIDYIGDGWLDIATQRRTAGDRINEPIRYIINPLRWLFSSQAGFIARWRGEPYGYTTYPVVYNERGEVWFNKEGIWQHGKISGKIIAWDTPQGTGIRAEKITGHEISGEGKKLYIQDK